MRNGRATEEEEDLLDMAPFLAENSQLELGHHITKELELGHHITKELDGIVLRLSRGTKVDVDGHVPQPH